MRSRSSKDVQGTVPKRPPRQDSSQLVILLSDEIVPGLPVQAVNPNLDRTPAIGGLRRLQGSFFDEKMKVLWKRRWKESHNPADSIGIITTSLPGNDPFSWTVFFHWLEIMIILSQSTCHIGDRPSGKGHQNVFHSLPSQEIHT
jgi:hypothetical protein